MQQIHYSLRNLEMLRSSLLILLLAGCAHTEPTIKVEIREVLVPVAIPCKSEVPATPNFKFNTIKPEDNMFDKSKTVLADRKLHLAYEEELLTALKSCL